MEFAHTQATPLIRRRAGNANGFSVREHTRLFGVPILYRKRPKKRPKASCRQVKKRTPVSL